MKTAFIISGESLNSRLHSFPLKRRGNSTFRLQFYTEMQGRRDRDETGRRSHSCPVLSDMFFSEPFSPFPLPG